MFTQQANSLLEAFSNFADPATSSQLLQAFANCNQQLVHRGGVSVQRQPAGNRGGVLGESPWTQQANNYYGESPPSTYDAYRPGSQWTNIYPQFAGDNFYNTSQLFEFGPINNVNNSNWYTRMGDTNMFDFSTRQGDLINNWGGPTFNVAGDSYFDNSVHNSQNVTNQNVTNQNVTNQTVENNETNNITIINNAPDGAGPQGPAGAPGDPGRAGVDGAPGGIIWVKPVLPDLRPRIARLPSYTLSKQAKSTEVVTGVTFDPDTCQIQLATTTINYVSAVNIQPGPPRFITYYGP